nr:hypothetical protein [Alteripontixanthobacter muriae]
MGSRIGSALPARGVVAAELTRVVIPVPRHVVDVAPADRILDADRIEAVADGGAFLDTGIATGTKTLAIAFSATALAVVPRRLADVNHLGTVGVIAIAAIAGDFAVGIVLIDLDIPVAQRPADIHGVRVRHDAEARDRAVVSIVEHTIEACGEVEVEELFRLGLGRVALGIALHGLPAGERASIASVLQLGAGHVCDTDIETAAHHDGHRHQSSREDRQRVAAAISCEGRKESVLVVHDQPTTPEYGEEG